MEAHNKALADKLALPLLAVGAVLVIACIVMTFTTAPLVQGAALSDGTSAVIGGVVVTTKLLLSQKIFYLHVPVAVASMVAMFFTALYGVRFLMTRKSRYDLRSRVATTIALVFVLATMVSGIFWTRFEWGVWWVWEPRLTTYFILMLLVIGYFILRNAIEDSERRATFAAVFGIVAFIDAPISFMVTRLVPSSIHPVVFRTDSGLPPNMLAPFLCGLFGMLMIAFALYRVTLAVYEQAEAVEELKEQLEEQDARRSVVAAERAMRGLEVIADDADADAERIFAEDPEDTGVIPEHASRPETDPATTAARAAAIPAPPSGSSRTER